MIHPRLVWDVVKQHPGVAQYQLVQREPRRFELRLVSSDPAGFPQVADALRADLRRLLGGAEVKATQHDALEPPQGHKFRAVVALAKPEPE